MLDLSFDGQGRIAVANSTGGIELWHERCSDDNKLVPVLSHQRTVQVAPSEILILSLHRHPFAKAPGKPQDETLPELREAAMLKRQHRDVFAVSLSDGAVAVVDCKLPDQDAVIWRTQAHSLEAWTVRWYSQLIRTNEESRSWIDSMLLFSGGDDSQLRFQSVPSHILDPTRKEKDHEDNSELEVDYALEVDRNSSWVDHRTHGAGVTAILQLTDAGNLDHNIVLTGSYDDKVRVMDISAVSCSKTKRRKCLAELDLGGGVWRLDMIDSIVLFRRYWVLASCMYAGCRVLEISAVGSGQDLLGKDVEWKIKVIATMEEHESMNYASIWVRSGPDRQRNKNRDGLWQLVWDDEVKKLSSDKPDGTKSDGTLRRFWDTTLHSQFAFDCSRIISTSFYDRKFCVWRPEQTALMKKPEGSKLANDE